MKEGIAWGFIDPKMVMEKATDSAKEFIPADVGPLTYVTDGRWMVTTEFMTRRRLSPYHHKTGGLAEQNFNF